MLTLKLKYISFCCTIPHFTYIEISSIGFQLQPCNKNGDLLSVIAIKKRSKTLLTALRNRFSKNGVHKTYKFQRF